MTNFNSFNNLYNNMGSPIGQFKLDGTLRNSFDSTIGRVDSLGNVTQLDGSYTGLSVDRTNHLVGPGANGFILKSGPRF